MRKRKKKRLPIDLKQMVAVASIGFGIAKYLDGEMTLDVAQRIIAINQPKEVEYYDDSDLRI